MYESLNLFVNVIFLKKNCNKNIVLDCMLYESFWLGIVFCFVLYIYDVWLNKYIYKKKNYVNIMFEIRLFIFN